MWNEIPTVVGRTHRRREHVYQITAMVDELFAAHKVHLLAELQV